MKKLIRYFYKESRKFRKQLKIANRLIKMHSNNLNLIPAEYDSVSFSKSISILVQLKKSKKKLLKNYKNYLKGDK